MIVTNKNNMSDNNIRISISGNGCSVNQICNPLEFLLAEDSHLESIFKTLLADFKKFQINKDSIQRGKVAVLKELYKEAWLEINKGPKESNEFDADRFYLAALEKVLEKNDINPTSIINKYYTLS